MPPPFSTPWSASSPLDPDRAVEDRVDLGLGSDRAVSGRGGSDGEREGGAGGAGGPGSTLHRLAAELGSDVPFFLEGGSCRARGRGERLESLPSRGDLHLLLLKPAEGMATARAYAMLDERPRPIRPCGSVDAWLPALLDGTLAEVAAGLHDDFQGVVAEAVPAVAEGLAWLVEEGALSAIMSGSGTAVFGLFPDGVACQRAGERANTLFPSWGAWVLRGEDRALVERSS